MRDRFVAMLIVKLRLAHEAPAGFGFEGGVETGGGGGARFGTDLVRRDY